MGGGGGLGVQIKTSSSLSSLRKAEASGPLLTEMNEFNISSPSEAQMTPDTLLCLHTAARSSLSPALSVSPSLFFIPPSPCEVDRGRAMEGLTPPATHLFGGRRSYLWLCCIESVLASLQHFGGPAIESLFLVV